MPASLIERSRRIAEITVSAMLATAGIVVFEVPQAFFKLLGKVSLYSFVLTFHLAFVIYHSTKPSSDDARGSRKPEEPGVSTRDYRFSSIKLSSNVLGELVSGDTAFVANISRPRSRSSTTSSEIARHSSSNTSIATLVEQTDSSKEATNIYPATPVPTRKHGTIFPDSEWATMNSTQIRRIRRAVKRVKYKKENGPPTRVVRSKASKASKISEGNKEDVVEDYWEPEQDISEEDKQEDSAEEDDQTSAKEDYSEGVKKDDTEADDEGSEGLMDDVFVYDKEGVEEEFMEKFGKAIKEGATIGDSELTEDDNTGAEEPFAGENDVKENLTEDDNVCIEEDFTENDEGGQEDVTKVNNEGVEDKIAGYNSAIVEKIFTVNDNEDVEEHDHERIHDVPEEHNKVDNEGVEDKVAAYDSTTVDKIFTVNDNERVQDDIPEERNKVDNEGVEDKVAAYDSTTVETIFTVNDNESVKERDYEHIRQDDAPEEHNKFVIDVTDDESHAKSAADGPCKSTPPPTQQRNGIIMIPSLIKGWPPVLLSEPVIDRLDPIDFKIMQLEYDYYLSREERYNDGFINATKGVPTESTRSHRYPSNLLEKIHSTRKK